MIWRDLYRKGYLYLWFVLTQVFTNFWKNSDATTFSLLLQLVSQCWRWLKLFCCFLQPSLLFAWHLHMVSLLKFLYTMNLIIRNLLDNCAYTTLKDYILFYSLGQGMSRRRVARCIRQKSLLRQTFRWISQKSSGFQASLWIRGRQHAGVYNCEGDESHCRLPGEE